ncbi:MAG: hypothetical protein IKY83_12050 [Proteobacteria bacterium]|nr:hypothetical protein [Pseudomonadota bacterium]
MQGYIRLYSHSMNRIQKVVCMALLGLSFCVFGCTGDDENEECTERTYSCDGDTLMRCTNDGEKNTWVKIEACKGACLVEQPFFDAGCIDDKCNKEGDLSLLKLPPSHILQINEDGTTTSIEDSTVFFRVVVCTADGYKIDGGKLRYDKDEDCTRLIENQFYECNYSQNGDDAEVSQASVKIICDQETKHATGLELTKCDGMCNKETKMCE